MIESFTDYKTIFIQRLPRYAIKSRKTWTSKNKALSDTPIKAHLAGKYAVGVLGKWYPEYCILDIDSKSAAIVKEIREKLNLNENNSMLFSSESPNSYHLLIKPEYHKKPPTLNLLKSVFEMFCRSHGIEVYPQRNKVIRLPFGAHQIPLDYEYAQLDSWQDYLYWFEKLDQFDLSSVKNHQMILNFESLDKRASILPVVIGDAQTLLDYGLQVPSSRHDSQFKVLYYLWRRNIPQETAEELVLSWITKKHNGFSTDIISHPRQVEKEIERQASFIYNKYQISQIYPDSTHNFFNGYITEPDLQDIVEATRASLPRMKFLFNLVKYSYPRRHRKLISIHRDKLVQWASWKTYLKYLDEFESKGLLKRRSAYQPSLFAKNLKMNWRYRSSNEAVLYEGRSVDSFDQMIRLIFQPDEFRQLLIKAESKQSTASKIINSIWKK